MDSLYYRTGVGGNVGQIDFKNLTLNKDDNGYFLSAEFTVNDRYSLREVIIPHINIPINPSKISIYAEYNDFGDLISWVDIGFGKLRLDYGEAYGRRVLYAEKIMDEHFVEMTLAEIENKLGYKIKIVDEKKEQ